MQSEQFIMNLSACYSLPKVFLISAIIRTIKNTNYLKLLYNWCFSVIVPARTPRIAYNILYIEIYGLKLSNSASDDSRNKEEGKENPPFSNQYRSEPAPQEMSDR